MKGVFRVPDICVSISFLLLCGTLFLYSACRKPEVPKKPPAAKVALVVKGTGSDMYSVFDAEGRSKLDFTRTNREVLVSPGVYTLLLNGSTLRVTVNEGTRNEVLAGSLQVKGKGTDLYELYAADGGEKMEFRYTGSTIEVFPGTYRVTLHGISIPVTVKEGDNKVIETGVLMVESPGHELYAVFDEKGEEKLDFRSTGKEIELFPGTYVVVVKEKKYTVTVKVNEKAVLSQ